METMIARVCAAAAARAATEEARATVCALPDILAIAGRYRLLDGIASIHVFDLVDGCAGVGLALSGHGLSGMQRTYSPYSPVADGDDCIPWMLGDVRLVFLDLGCREHMAWLLAANARQEEEHDRPAVRVAA